MKLKWTSTAYNDLSRLHAFLAKANPKAANRTVRVLVAAPTRLLAQPKIGETLNNFEPRDVRRILSGRYEMRYEIQEKTIYILRIWHVREDR